MVTADIKVLGIWRDKALHWKFSLGMLEHVISDAELRTWLILYSGFEGWRLPVKIINKMHYTAYIDQVILKTDK